MSIPKEMKMSLNKPQAQFETQESTDATVENTAVNNAAAQAKENSSGNTVETSAKGAAAPEAKVLQAKDDAKVAAEAATRELQVVNEEAKHSTTAIATATSSALAAPKVGSKRELLDVSNVLVNELQNSLPVTWEDFTAINANQGQFQIKGADTTKPIGKEIELKLVSFQDQWVSGPEDTESDVEGILKYSDDGVNLNDDSGMTIAEHQKFIASQGEEPKLSHRLVLVGELLKAEDAAMDVIGELVQVILSESGRRNFTSHTKQVAYQIANGRMASGDAEHIKLIASSAGTGKKQYTLVKTTYGEGHGPKKS